MAAGMAVRAMSLWRMAARKDVTHAEVVDALRAHGCNVLAISAPGAPDLVVALRTRQGVETHMIEVKRQLGPRGGSSGRELNPRQRAWRAKWIGKVWVLRSARDAADWVRERMENES